MAHLDCEGITTPERFNAELRKMDKGTLYGQQLVQQGAVHAVTWLLENGCNAVTAKQMLESLRVNERLLRAEALRRGYHDLFPPEEQHGS